jgi:hypothetical protein
MDDNCARGRHDNIAPSVIPQIVDRRVGDVVIEDLFSFEHFGLRMAGMNDWTAVLQV